MNAPSPALSDAAERIPKIRIEATLAAKINLADFQNAVPVAREFSVVNESVGDLKDVRLTVSSEPAFLKSRTWHLDQVAAGNRVRIGDLDLPLDGALLGRLTEAEKATVTFRLEKTSSEMSELASCEIGVELLPRNQWGGLSTLPEMVAAFVQPNEPAVEQILKRAAEFLRQSGKTGALDGYQGGTRRAWELASAIWSAIGAMGLDYALPPASFEHAGQKVRSPSQIADSGLATCLDLSLLACAALEQAGLHPMLVFTRGHAFPGVWLQSEEFSLATVDDVTALRKRIKLKEMVLFESTFLTQRPVPAFSYAISRGEEQIAEDAERRFELVVDIRRARLQRIKPLASERAVVHGPGAKAAESPPAGIEEAPDLPESSPVREDGVPERPEDRLMRWQRKLLDLSMRNNLLNFKAGKKSLKLDAPDPGRLEDMLAGRQALRLLTRPDLMDGKDPRSQAIHEARERENLRHQHALDALKRHEVFVGLPQAEMEARLIELYRGARTAIQEGGANILYLALGFISWTRDDNDGKTFRAPLILIPVALDRRSARSGFSLKLYDEEARFNPTLIEMLRQDFGLELGVRDTELPKDDSGLNVAGIWKTVSHAIKDIKGWEVVEDVVLATFSFAKYLMWKDLTEQTEKLRQNAVVRHLIDTPRDTFESSVPFPDPRRLDVELPAARMFCPLPADSSQLSAIVAGSRGKDFVLIGPPGTGKSQTISNMIAQCLAEHKRVLFVSEKMAALDVVYRRLAEVGLGRFCLELHSNKARKSDVLEQLRTSWDTTATLLPEEWEAQAARLGTLRAQLNGYVERLHLRHANGLSVYEAIGTLVSGVAVPAFSLSWPSAQAHDLAGMQRLRETADYLDVNAAAMRGASLAANPLAHVAQTEWSPMWQAALLEEAGRVGPAVSAFDAAATALQSAIGLPALPMSPRTREALRQLGESLPRAFGHDWRFVLCPDAKMIADELRTAAPLLERYRARHQALSTPVERRVLEALQIGIGQVSRMQELRGELSRPWNDTLRARLDTGISLLRSRQELRSRLSRAYPEEMSGATVKQLQQEWQEAQESVWPLGTVRRRALRKKLEQLGPGSAQPDLASDIDLLAKIEGLQEELGGYDDLSLPTAGAWAGLKTDLDVARAALGIQVVLDKVRGGQPWEDVGLEPVARAQCGEMAQADLRRLREMRQIEHAIVQGDGLAAETEGIWSGVQTDLPLARAYLAYQQALMAAREDQPWQDEGLTVIAAGRAGTRAADDVKRMRELVELRNRLQEYADLRDKSYQLWSGQSTRLDHITPALDFYAILSGALAQLSGTPETFAAVKASISLLLNDGNALLEPDGIVVGAARTYADALQALNAAVSRFAAASGLLKTDDETLGSLLPAQIADKARGVLESSNRLNAWCAWRKARQQALGLGLGSMVRALETGVVFPGKVREAFETNYCRWWLNAVVDADEVLRTFVSAEHEKRIRDFRELDAHFTRLTQAWVSAQLSAGHPSPDRVAKGSEWGLLRYEMQKKTKHLPLRDLMSTASGAVLQLTPCLLMSPLSIAQYLPATTAQFDVVIFDEASQIAVWDAIGALARAKQVIMVGDPKQLPPTSFFDRAESAEDDIDVETELESILEECIGANLPTMNLAWHYRSRHESLIAFSNYRYYQGSLVTFPSPVTTDQAVSFHFVPNGRYERGGARNNQVEAKALVADLVAKLKSPGFRVSGHTVGVVTFNAEQQSLIEDLLDDERRKDPSIEGYFLETRLEPVFVKNLESVQGDERDVMYFSPTYGPNLEGILSMNFGPLNQQGGERRLNVAITRARHELRIFSSFRPEQMDLARTQALGVRDLKHFLEFAERGARALGEAVAGSVGDFDSPFEKAVAAALADKGWVVHPQVGVSAFRIDLGIVDPEAPGRYLAGVECDGATYHRSSSARDRDKLREQVLRGLGWEILRIWSTDWWIDASGTLDHIHAQLEALLAARRAERLMREQEVEGIQKKATSPVPTLEEGATSEGSQAMEGCTPPASTKSTVPVVYARNTAVSEPQPAAPKAELVETDLLQAGHVADAQAFFDAGYEARLLAMIEHVVGAEGPVRDEVLARRIARAHGWYRTGGRIQQRVADLARQRFRSEEEDVGLFFWPQTAQTGAPIMFRRPAAGTSRSVDEIAFAELVSLAGELQAVGRDKESGLPEMAKAIGLMKLRVASRERLERAWVKASV